MTFRSPVAAVSLAVSLVAGCSTGGSELRSPRLPSAGAVTLSIVGTNDLHGAIAPTGVQGGLALLGGYMNNLRAARARDGGAVLLVDAGDMFQGSLESNLTEGASVVAAYNRLGYSAAAIGNHEFDFGPVGPSAIPRGPADDPRGALKARASETSFPLLAANLIDDATGQPVAWRNVRPAVMVEAAGVKVGVIGVMTRNALSATSASNTTGLRVAPLAPAIATHASHLRQQGAAVVVVTAHAGGRCTAFDDPRDLSSCALPSEIIEVARSLAPGLVDVIVGGHVHAAMAHEVNGIAITQATSGGRAFGRVDVRVARGGGRVTSRIYPPQAICAREDPATRTCEPDTAAEILVPSTYEGAPVTPDPTVAAAIAPALERVSALKATLLGVLLETPIPRDTATTESPLGNLFSDAFRDSVAGADVAINNTYGGLRADLPAGPLTYGSVFTTFPFDNRLATLRLTGADLREMFTAILGEGGRAPGVSGLRVRAHCESGRMEVRISRPSGAVISDDQELTVVTTDFLALGGDGIFGPVMPPGGFLIPDDLPVARDIVTDWLKRRGGTLSARDLMDETNPRWLTADTKGIRCGG